jgi:GTP-binding protein HflX
MSDTVGFIRKLPHHLVEAFKATLEELTYAKLLVHVIDASNPNWAQQVEIVDELILELGAENTPRIEVFNKFDAVSPDAIMPKGDNIVRISAKTGEGVDELIKKIGQLLDEGKRRGVIRLPYDRAGLLELLHSDAAVERVEYCDSYIEVAAVMAPEVYGKVKPYIFMTDYIEQDPEDYWNEGK